MRPANTAAPSSGSNEGAAVRAGDMPRPEVPDGRRSLLVPRSADRDQVQYGQQGDAVTALAGPPERSSLILPREEVVGGPARQHDAVAGSPDGSAPSASAPARTLHQDTETMAVALVVAPDNRDEAISAVEPDRLLSLIWWLEEIVRRANAAKKGALIEAVMASQRGEISRLLEVGGHHYELREDRRSDWEDIPGLLYVLNRQGASITDLAAAVSGLRVTDLEKVCASLDEDVRADAYETVRSHRVYKPTAPALIDVDSPYRRRSITGKKENT